MVEGAEREWYVRTQFPLLAWSSLASAFSLRDTFANASARSAGYSPCVAYDSPANVARLERAATLAAQKQASPAQIAIAYVLNDCMNTFSVVSSSNISHMEQNLAAAGIHLTEPERRWLNLESDRVF